MAVKNFFSGIFDFFLSDQESAPKDYIDQQNCKDCQHGIKEPGITAALNAAADVGDQISPNIKCMPLGVGDARVLNVGHDQSPTGVEHRYALKRVAEKSFEATLNIEFSNAHSGNPKDVTEKMRAKVKSCMQETNGSLVGPKGELLVLRLQEESDGYLPRAPKVVIEIDKPKFHTDSRTYGQEESCPVIIHELLHLMGLVDEYAEQTTSAKESCRAIGPKDSIMRDDKTGWVAALGTHEEYTCLCPRDQNLDKCKAALKKEAAIGDFPSCPDGSVRSFKEAKEAELSSGVAIKKLLRAKSRSHNKSILKPAHFNALVYPGCVEINQTYYLCAQDAYSTPTGPNRKGCILQTPPRACANGSTDWLENPGK